MRAAYPRRLRTTRNLEQLLRRWPFEAPRARFGNPIFRIKTLTD
jgi:hypothetical protein